MTSRSTWRHLRTAPISLIVSCSHRLALRASVELAEVADEPMILGRPGDVLRETMDDYFRLAAIRPRIRCDADEPAAAEDFVTVGLGISFIPELVTPTPRDPLTVRIPISDPACALTLGIAWNEDRYLSLAARAFRNHAIAVLNLPLPSMTPSAGRE